MSATIRVEPPRRPEVLALLQASDDFTRDLYPPESCYLLDVDDLERQGVTVFVARVDDAAVGIVALVDRGDGSAEVKRMFVSESARGHGAATALLRSLEELAADRGLHTLQLETGPLNHAAIALYERLGYGRIPNFPPYVGDEFSICMEKTMREKRKS
jgi:putative acetyltransferase